MCRPKTEVACHLVLQRLYLGREEFDHFAAFGADHVIVMLVVVMMLVVGLTVTEAHLTRQTSIREKLQRSVNGCEADIRIDLVNEPVKILTGQVLLGTEEGVQDQIPLLRPAETGGLYMLKEQLSLCAEFVFFTSHDPLST